MAHVWDPDQIRSKHKATTALFPYAVQREQRGEGGMIDAFFGVLRASKLGTFAIGPQITALLYEGSPDSLNRVIALASPYALWNPEDSHGGMVTRWAAAVLAVPYTEEVGQSVVDALLQIASFDSLQPHIPVDVWALLKERPSLPPVCVGRSRGTTGCVVRRVRELGDPEILKSYLLLVWSEWHNLHPEGLTDMCASIRQEFSGIGMGGHRKELIERLEHILGRLDHGPGYPEHHRPRTNDDLQRVRRQYQELKDVLLGVDEEAMEILIRASSRSTDLFDPLTLVAIRRISLDVHLCPPAPVPVVVRLYHSRGPCPPNPILQSHAVSPPCYPFIT